MTDQIAQPSKTNPKWKAIASLILGIISIINGIGVMYLPIIIQGLNKPFPPVLVGYIYDIYGNITTFLAVNSLISVIGIILGKIGLKSTKKAFAIAGIMLSIIGLLGTIFFYLFIRMMSGIM